MLALLILYLLGIGLHGVAVFGLGKDFFKIYSRKLRDKDIPRIFVIFWKVCTRLYVYSIFVPLGTFVIVLCELAWKPSAVIKKNLTFFGGHFTRWMGETKIQIGWLLLYKEDCIFSIYTFYFMPVNSLENTHRPFLRIETEHSTPPRTARISN